MLAFLAVLALLILRLVLASLAAVPALRDSLQAPAVLVGFGFHGCNHDLRHF
jgi:hypothetical protein